MTQPAVTFQIKQLEEHFDTRLLERGHGKFGLTPAGEIVFDYAERILALNEEPNPVSELTDEPQARSTSAPAPPSRPTGFRTCSRNSRPLSAGDSAGNGRKLRLHRRQGRGSGA